MGYTKPIQTAVSVGFGSSNPLDSTTYYGAEPVIALTTSTAIRNVYIPVKGVVRYARLDTYSASVTGTNEDIVIAIRINNTTDYTFATVGSATARRSFVNAALNIPVEAGDYVEFKVTTPAWVTNPEGMRGYGFLIIETA